MENLYPWPLPKAGAVSAVPLAALTVMVSAMVLFLFLVFVKHRRGEGAFLPSVASLALVLLLLASGIPLKSLLFGAPGGPVVPPWPFTPRADRHEVTVLVNHYREPDNSFKYGELIHGYTDGKTGRLVMFHNVSEDYNPLSISGGVWYVDLSPERVNQQGVLDISVSVQDFSYQYGYARFSFSGSAMVPIVGSDKGPHALVGSAIFDKFGSMSAAATLTNSCVAVISWGESGYSFSINGYSYSLILLGTRSLVIRVTETGGVPFVRVVGDVFGEFSKVEEGVWEARWTQPSRKVNFRVVGYDNDGTEHAVASGYIDVSLSLQISLDRYSLYPFFVARGSGRLVRERETGTVLNQIWHGSLPQLSERLEVFVNARTPWVVPPPPIRPPPGIRIRTNSVTIPEGILLSADATYDNGDLLPPEAEVWLVFPLTQKMIQVEKDEWILLVPKEYAGVVGRVEVRLPGYSPFDFRIPFGETEVSFGSLKVVVVDKKTGAPVKGAKVVCRDRVKYTSSAAVFEELPSGKTVVYVTKEGYYGTQVELTVYPYTVNEVTVELVPYPSPEPGEGTATLVIYVTPEFMCKEKLSVPTIFLAGNLVSWAMPLCWPLCAPPPSHPFNTSGVVVNLVSREEIKNMKASLVWNPNTLSFTVEFKGIKGKHDVTIALAGYFGETVKIFENKTTTVKLEPSERRPPPPESGRGTATLVIYVTPEFMYDVELRLPKVSLAGREVRWSLPRVLPPATSSFSCRGVIVQNENIETSLAWNPNTLSFTVEFKNIKGSYDATIVLAGYCRETVKIFENKTTTVRLKLCKYEEKEVFGSLEVRVREKETNIPIEGAVVLLSNGAEAKTDAGGRAFFRSLPYGRYSVSVVTPGYLDATVRTEVRGNVALDVYLASYLYEAPAVRMMVDKLLVFFLLIFIAAGALLAWRRG